MNWFFTPLLALLIVGCSTPAPPTPPVQFDWSKQPARELQSASATLVFTGRGEDRNAENAAVKAKAFALQDLQNECSFIPKNVLVSPEHHPEQVGVIYRDYVQISVTSADCGNAQKQNSSDAIKLLADAELTREVETYQNSYDAPEAEETAPLKTIVGPLREEVRYFTARQQIALTNEKTILLREKPLSSVELVSAKQAVFEFGKSVDAFSDKRINWPNHQAQALRETIAERKRLKAEYGYTPTSSSSPTKKSSGRGKGSKRHPQPPAETP